MRGWMAGRGRGVVNLFLVALMAALYLFTATPQAQSAMSDLNGSPVYRGHRKGAIALSCAVSWNAKSIPALLDTLAEREISATFFVSGAWAKENGPLLRRMTGEGHEIGVMGMEPLADGDALWVEADVRAAMEAIRDGCGAATALYYSGTREIQPSARAAGKLGLIQVLCTVDLLSARGNTQDVLSRALERPFDGSIILMQPTAEAVRALPACLDGWENLGYAITTVSGVL